jgi:hypothetical protein
MQFPNKESSTELVQSPLWLQSPFRILSSGLIKGVSMTTTSGSKTIDYGQI